MKKHVFLLVLSFLLTTNAFAVPATNLGISGGDGKNKEQVYFEVESAGLYYVGIPFDSTKSDIYYVTSFFTKYIDVDNTSPGVNFNVVDVETNTLVNGYCID